MYIKIFRLKDDCQIDISAKAVINAQRANDNSVIVFHHVPTLTEAVRFRHHQSAYNTFVVCKGRFQFWNNQRGHNLGPIDFVFVPPGTVYGYKCLEPESEFIILTTVHDIAGLGRVLRHGHSGELCAASDNQSGDVTYDIHFQQTHLAPDILTGLEIETSLPAISQPYFLRITNSASWMLGPASRRRSQMEVHCFYVIQGVLQIKFKADPEWTFVQQGQAIMVPERQEFTADSGSAFLRLISFSNGAGIDNVVCKAGSKREGPVLPETSR
ncbi:hypothetical protein ACHAPT_013626 [Fusarium lateritium]